MMLLAIDTSTRYAGVALWKEERPVSTRCWYSQRNHTAELMPAIESILAAARAPSTLSSRDGKRVSMNQELEGGPRDTPEALKAIAVAMGPGGFSAIRVGISAAKGLALPLNIPVIGVGTLEMEAYPYAETGMPICPLLEAGRGEVAAALFQRSRGRWRKLEEERICKLEDLAGSITRRTLICGEGVAQHGEYLGQALGRTGVIISSYTSASRLWALAAVAMERLARGPVDAVDSLGVLQPLYLRSPSIGAPKKPQRVSR